MEGTSQGNLSRAVIALLFMVMCIGSLVFVWNTISSPNGPLQASQEYAHEEKMAAMPKTYEERSLDTVKDVAEAGFAANVAIAISGDASQASMAKSYSSAIWALAIVIVGAIVLTVMLSNRKSSRHEYGGGGYAQLFTNEGSAASRRNDVNY